MKTIEQLTQELEAAKQEIHSWKSMHDAQMKESKWLKSELLDKEGELEAVKKERDELKHKFVALQFDVNEAVPSEVNEAANYYCQGNMFFAAMKSGFIMGWKWTKNLSRLTSGETKLERCRECDNGYTTRKGIDFSCQHCNGSGFITPTNPANEQETNQPEIPESSPSSHLVSVEDRLPDHTLKVWTEYYEDVESGKKPFEVRLDDRKFTAGDLLNLKSFDYINQAFTGRECNKIVTYKLTGGQFGIEKGFCVLGLKPLPAPPESLTDKK